MTNASQREHAASALDHRSRAAISLLPKEIPKTGEAEKLIELLAAVGDRLPLRYRSQEADDWGVIRDQAGDVIAVSRQPAWDTKSLHAHRCDKTDPYELYGRLFVDSVNALPGLLDLISSLEGEVERLKASPEGWRDISTAPKDGRFLVYGGKQNSDLGGGEPSKVALIDRYLGGQFDVADTCYYHVWVEGPTRWMPEPQPPACSEGGGE